LTRPGFAALLDLLVTESCDSRGCHRREEELHRNSTLAADKYLAHSDTYQFCLIHD
jgi:hypothetical protein